jgi:hypothetical protein
VSKNQQQQNPWLEQGACCPPDPKNKIRSHQTRHTLLAPAPGMFPPYRLRAALRASSFDMALAWLISSASASVYMGQDVHREAAESKLSLKYISRFAGCKLAVESITWCSRYRGSCPRHSSPEDSRELRPVVRVWGLRILGPWGLEPSRALLFRNWGLRILGPWGLEPSRALLFRVWGLRISGPWGLEPSRALLFRVWGPGVLGLELSRALSLIFWV